MEYKNMDPEQIEVLRKEAVQHLHFVIGLYKLKFEGGRHFLRDHSATASRWADPQMEIFMNQRAVSKVVVTDQCEYGPLTPGPNG